jgi:magnesium transporter
VEVREDNFEEITAELAAIVEARDGERAGAFLSAIHASDIGRMLIGLTEDDAVFAFRTMDAELASEVFLEVDDSLRKVLIEAITPDELIDVVDEMETDDAADVISELHPEDARQVLDGIDTEDAREVEKLLVYPDDTAGGKMQAELISVSDDATVESAIAEVRRKGKGMENLTTIFVVDAGGRLVGIVPLATLILEDPATPISEIDDVNPFKVTTDLDQEEVARMFQKYDLLSMPVVDPSGILVGRITIDDVVDVIEEEIFEDFYKMAGLNVEERVLGPARRAIWMRLPWLFVYLGAALLTVSVVKFFEGTIEKLVLLAVLMPVVAGMGGNAGTQAITVVVRGLALGEIDIRNSRKVLVKEGIVGLSNGLILGFFATFISYLFGGGFFVGLLLFLGMAINMVIAGLSGAFIPLVLKRFRVDPAISSSIFVTTCTDVGGFLVFLGLATIFMGMGLL